MNFDDVKKKIQNINWKAFFTSRNFIIVCSVLILGAAIIVYTAATSGGGDIDTKGGSKTLGNTVLVGGMPPRRTPKTRRIPSLPCRLSTGKEPGTKPWTFYRQ